MRSGADRQVYTVSQVVAQTGFSERRVQRLFARFRKRGWPRVWDELNCKGVPRSVVDALEYDAVGRGELSELPAS